MISGLSNLAQVGTLGVASTGGLTKAALIARLKAVEIGALACYMPSEYATTGWQRYDAASARAAVGYGVGFLGDAMQGMALGLELIINGDFSAGITGWGLQDASLAVVDGAGAITSTSTAGLVYQGNPSSVGKFYRMASTLVNGTGAAARMVGTGGLYLTYNSPSPSNIVRSRSSTLYFYCRTGGGVGLVSYHDNCSLAEILGNHSSQETESSRPTLRYAGGLYYLDPTSGQGLTAYLPASVGGTVTVVYANPGVGAVVVTGVAVTSQAVWLPYRYSGLVIMPSGSSTEAVAAVAALVDVLARRVVV